MLIDARGQGCPKPVMMVDEALSGMKEGIIEILVDNEASSLNVEGYARQKGLIIETLRAGNDWKIKIVKGFACKPIAESEMVNAEPGEKKICC